MSTVTSLKSVHLFFIVVAIVITAGTGAWGFRTAHELFGAVSLGVGAVLVAYLGYFVNRTMRMHIN